MITKTLSKDVRVTLELHHKLSALKGYNGCRSFQDVIAFLIDFREKHDN